MSTQQAADNFHRAATMSPGSSFQLPATGHSAQAIQQAEQFCNMLRQKVGEPGRVTITVRGGVATIRAGQ